jgi:hypothetical protein
MKNLFAAVAAIRAREAGDPWNHKKGRGRVIGAGHYPAVPAQWASRAIRRAIRNRKESRLPAEWKQYLAVNPNFRTMVLTAETL